MEPARFDKTEVELYKVLGKLERKNEDLFVALHKIANVHNCPSCIYDAMDEVKHIAERAMERNNDA